LLRESLIGALARMDDPAVIAEARRLYASDSEARPLPAATRRPVYLAVATHADRATWEDMARRAREARSPLEQRFYLEAMARARDATLAQRALELTLTDAAPKQLAPNLIRAVAAQHPDLAWRFYLANRAAVDARLDPLQRLEFAPSLASGADDAARIAELQAFADRHIPAGSRTAVEQAVSQMRYNAEVRGRVRPEVDRWLAAHLSAAGAR
jgi:aminopeptidase N